MKITLLTYGSQGDVEPFIALAKGLQDAGHQTRLAAPKLYSHLVKDHKIDYVNLPGNPNQLVKELVEDAGGSWWRIVHSVAGFVLPLAKDVFSLAQESCRDADLVIHSFLMTNTGFELARINNIPDISLQTFPVFTSTSEFPSPIAPDLPLGKIYRRLTHDLVTQTFWVGSRIIYDRIRKKNPDLPSLTNWPFNKQNKWRTPILYGFSPTVVPQPSDWREGARVIGYLFEANQDNWKPEPELSQFLETGSVPITAAFGSTRSPNLIDLYLKIIRAVTNLGERAVLVGSADFDLPSSPAVFQAGYLPYDWIFKRSSAVVHHGGAGTTGKALQAGIPNIVLPFTSDQPFWGRQVYKLGAGPKPINPKKITVKELEKAILATIKDQEMNLTAQKISRDLKTEDGVSNAIKLIEKIGV